MPPTDTHWRANGNTIVLMVLPVNAASGAVTHGRGAAPAANGLLIGKLLHGQTRRGQATQSRPCDSPVRRVERMAMDAKSKAVDTTIR